jgi:hypothetical protein
MVMEMPKKRYSKSKTLLIKALQNQKLGRI